MSWERVLLVLSALGLAMASGVLFWLFYVSFVT